QFNTQQKKFYKKKTTPQTATGAANPRLSLFGFYVLSKTCFAIQSFALYLNFFAKIIDIRSFML
ncbi:MAG: hypothetical protein ACK400_12505, partial [Pseudanabaena sp.]